MRLLIDHTTLHSLVPRSIGSRVFSLRGILQLAEELFLADEIWITDAEGGQTWRLSSEIIDQLEQGGLAHPDGSGLVKILHVSSTRLVDILKTASVGLYEDLLALEIDDSYANYSKLRQRAKIHVAHIRPAGTIAHDYVSFLSKVPKWDSKEREQVLAEAVEEKEFASSAALFLVNEDLFRWGKKCVSINSNADDPLYDHLRVLCRWHINSAHATLPGKSNLNRGDEVVHYAPAYGRTLALGQTYIPNDVATLHFLDSELYKGWAESRGQAHAAVGASATSPKLPLVGAAVLLKLKESASLQELFSTIGELRDDKTLMPLRKWWRSSPKHPDVADAIEALKKRLKLDQHSTSTLRARFTLSATSRPKAEVVSEKDITNIGQMDAFTAFRRLISRPHVTAFAPFLEPVFENSKLISELVPRIESIQQSWHR